MREIKLFLTCHALTIFARALTILAIPKNNIQLPPLQHCGRNRRVALDQNITRRPRWLADNDLKGADLARRLAQLDAEVLEYLLESAP